MTNPAEHIQDRPDVYVLTIPAPDAWMNANDRHHWAKKAKLTRKWREAAAWAARRADLPRFENRVHVTVFIHKTHGRSYDASNWAPTGKAAVDGLRDAGVLIDDSNRYVIGPDMRAGARATEGAYMRLLIEEIKS